MSNNKDHIGLANVIFDSRTASSVYKDYDYYRSETFDVPPGHVGVLELTTHSGIAPEITFNVNRVVGESACLSDCTDKFTPMKPFRRARCTQGIDNPTSGKGLPTQVTTYNKALVILGNHQYLKQCVEHDYIDRPGRYYVLGGKSSLKNEEYIDNKNCPTIIEVSIVPVSQIPELMLPC